MNATSDNRKRIALWGYGRYGKRLLDNIQRHWPRKYVVTMAFDRSAKQPDATCLDGTTPLRSPEAIGAGYREGLFDAVLVSMSTREGVEECSADLAAQGIPQITLISEDDFRFIDAFEDAASSPLAPDYELHEYRSLYGVYMDESPIQSLLYLFDARGFILYDNWYRNDLVWNPLAKNPMLPPMVPDEGVVDLPGEYCAVARMWGTNYGHIIYQVLSQIALMEERGYQGKYLIAYASAAEQLLNLMGMDKSRIIWLEDLDEETVYRFEKMLVAEHWEYHHATVAAPAVEAARVIEAAVLSRCEGDLGSYPRRLFVKRTGTRRLLNVEDTLAKYGFQTIVPEELSVEEQIRHFHAANVVLSPHGANSTNSIFMRPGASFIETFGAGLVAPWCHDTLRIKGVRYFPVPETPIYPTTTREVYRDYAVHPAILGSIIESAIELSDGGI